MATLDYIKVNTEIQEEFKDLMLSQFGNSENIQAIIDIIASEATDQEQLFVDLAEGFKLENAIGAQLDIIGEFVGVEREGVDDETYRSKIAVAIAGITLGVTRDGIAEMAKLLSGGVLPEIYLGRFRDVYLYMEQLCFDPSVIGPQLGQYFPLNTQGQVIITAGVPFGFEDDDSSSGFGTTEDLEDAYGDSGSLSNLVFTSFESQDFIYRYLLDSDTVSIIGLSEGYDKPLVNIEGFTHFAIENIDPVEEVLYMSTRQPGGIEDLNKFYSGDGDFNDYQTPARTVYYEIEPTVVQDYEIGVIQHSLIMGSVVDGASPGNDALLSISLTLDCENPTPAMKLTVNKVNMDSTSAKVTVEYSGISNIQNKRFGIYLNPLTRELGYTYDGVDQGLFLADTSSDPEIAVGEPFTWVDRRAYNGFFLMEGKRTTDPLMNPDDIIAMRWYNDRSEISSAAPEGSTDIFGRTI